MSRPTTAAAASAATAGPGKLPLNHCTAAPEFAEAAIKSGRDLVVGLTTCGN